MMNVDALLSRNRPFIDGPWIEVRGGVEALHINPNTGMAIGARWSGGAREIDLAFLSAVAAFTGNAAVARRVMSIAATLLKPVFIQLGGKSPNIICEDADLDHAAPLAAGACLILAGQRCVNPTRLVLHDAVYDEIVPRLEAFSQP